MTAKDAGFLFLDAFGLLLFALAMLDACIPSDIFTYYSLSQKKSSRWFGKY